MFKIISTSESNNISLENDTNKLVKVTFLSWKLLLMI